MEEAPCARGYNRFSEPPTSEILNEWNYSHVGTVKGNNPTNSLQLAKGRLIADFYAPLVRVHFVRHHRFANPITPAVGQNLIQGLSFLPTHPIDFVITNQSLVLNERLLRLVFL